MNFFGYGYCAGVLDANPDATILQYNANNFGDASGGKTAVNTMVTKGADVVFHAAGGTGIGVIDGCKENKIWAIGADLDQSPLAPETILTSALKRVDNACYDATKKTILEHFEVGVLRQVTWQQAVLISLRPQTTCLRMFLKRSRRQRRISLLVIW